MQPSGRKRHSSSPTTGTPISQTRAAPRVKTSSASVGARLSPQDRLAAQRRLGISGQPTKGSSTGQGAASPPPTKSVRQRAVQVSRQANDGKHGGHRGSMPLSNSTHLTQANRPAARSQTKMVQKDPARTAGVKKAAADSPSKPQQPAADSSVRFHYAHSPSTSSDASSTRARTPDGKYQSSRTVTSTGTQASDKWNFANVANEFRRPEVPQKDKTSWDLGLLTPPGPEPFEFANRAEAMAKAVCESGNQKVPASLIKALIDFNRRGNITGAQLNIALEKLVEARFKGNIPEDGMVAYLSIVGKAANGPDERVSALKPLAAAMRGGQQHALLNTGIDLASQYWPSWRKVDTAVLGTGQPAQSSPPPGKPPAASDRPTAQALLTEAQAGPLNPGRIRTLALSSGDAYLKPLVEELVKLPTLAVWQPGAREARENVEIRVFTGILEDLADQRKSFELSIRPYLKVMESLPRKSEARRTATQILCRMAGKRENSSDSCLATLRMALNEGRPLSKELQQFYELGKERAASQSRPPEVVAAASPESLNGEFDYF